MLSILIPCYNYNIFPLVSELHSQCKAMKIRFEILVYDDASNSNFDATNASINHLHGCLFKVLPHNIGRSKIRNLLGRDATYDNLVFLDADTYPKHGDFVEKYANHVGHDVVYGGITNEERIPTKPYKLRWLYTKKRETESICSSNFMIDKSIFLLHPFDETLTTYGYEDVVFFEKLKQNKVLIKSIDNQAIHCCRETAEAYISKIEKGLENLVYLVDTNKLSAKESKLYRYYLWIQRFKMNKFVVFLFRTFKKNFIKNFNSSNPSILLLDFYKLGYFCLLKSTR